MCEMINVSAYDGATLSLSRYREKLHCFCEYGGYEDYDAKAGCDDIVTRHQFDAVNDAMKANAPLRPWLKYLSPNPIPGLSNVSTDIDLIDSPDDDYVPAKQAVRAVHQTLCRDPEIDDMASSRVCHPNCPRRFERGSTRSAPRLRRGRSN
jgi:hypothetical protein